MESDTRVLLAFLVLAVTCHGYVVQNFQNMGNQAEQDASQVDALLGQYDEDIQQSENDIGQQELGFNSATKSSTNGQDYDDDLQLIGQNGLPNQKSNESNGQVPDQYDQGDQQSQNDNGQGFETSSPSTANNGQDYEDDLQTLDQKDTSSSIQVPVQHLKTNTRKTSTEKNNRIDTSSVGSTTISYVSSINPNVELSSQKVSPASGLVPVKQNPTSPVLTPLSQSAVRTTVPTPVTNTQSSPSNNNPVLVTIKQTVERHTNPNLMQTTLSIVNPTVPTFTPTKQSGGNPLFFGSKPCNHGLGPCQHSGIHPGPPIGLPPQPPGYFGFHPLPINPMCPPPMIQGPPGIGCILHHGPMVHINSRPIFQHHGPVGNFGSPPIFHRPGPIRYIGSPPMLRMPGPISRIDAYPVFRHHGSVGYIAPPPILARARPIGSAFAPVPVRLQGGGHRRWHPRTGWHSDHLKF